MIVSRAKQFARSSGTANSLLSFSYIVVLVLSSTVFFFFSKDEVFVRYGAAVVVLATGLTGVHLFRVFKAANYFDIEDPVRPQSLGDLGMSRPEFKSHASLYTDDASRMKARKTWMIRLANLKTANLRSKIISKTVLWETSLLSIGSLIWGFGDLILCGLG